MLSPTTFWFLALDGWKFDLRALNFALVQFSFVGSGNDTHTKSFSGLQFARFSRPSPDWAICQTPMDLLALIKIFSGLAHRSLSFCVSTLTHDRTKGSRNRSVAWKVAWCAGVCPLHTFTSPTCSYSILLRGQQSFYAIYCSIIKYLRVIDLPFVGLLSNCTTCMQTSLASELSRLDERLPELIVLMTRP